MDYKGWLELESVFDGAGGVNPPAAQQAVFVAWLGAEIAQALAQVDDA